MDRERLKPQLIRHEGIRLKPYRCPAGRTTVGVGRNLDANGVSRDEAMFMLDNDLDRVMDGLDATWPWWRSLSEPRQSVLVDMAFNLGLGGLAGFRKFMTLVRDHSFAEAAREMLQSRWAGQVGGRARTLANMLEGRDEPGRNKGA